MATIKSSAEDLTLNADGSGNDILLQSNGSQVGSLTAEGVFTATSFAGSGASLTALNATNLGSGTVPAARITASSIANDLIDSQHYAAASIDNEHLADNAVDTAEIADNAITLAKMASGTDGNIISFDASGNPVAIATGSDGEVLTSAGAGAPPAFEALAASGSAIEYHDWRLTANSDYASSNRLNLEGDNMNEESKTSGATSMTVTSDGHWAFPSTGNWLILFNCSITCRNGGSADTDHRIGYNTGSETSGNKSQPGAIVNCGASLGAAGKKGAFAAGVKAVSSTLVQQGVQFVMLSSNSDWRFIGSSERATRCIFIKLL